MEIPQIQIHDAKKKLDEKASLFIDIRDPGSYEQAHIPGAIRLHDGNVQEFLQSRISCVDLTQSIDYLVPTDTGALVLFGPSLVALVALAIWRRLRRP